MRLQCRVDIPVRRQVFRQRTKCPVVAIGIADRELLLASQHLSIGRPRQPFCDPGLEYRNLSITQFVAAARHLQFALLPNRFDEQTLIRLSHGGRRPTRTSAENPLTRREPESVFGFVTGMTLETSLCEHRPNLPLEERHVVSRKDRRIILRTFRDPSSQQIDLSRRQRIAVLRHRRFFDAGQHLNERTLIRLTGHDRRTKLIAPATHRLQPSQIQSTALLIVVMTLVAAMLQKRKNLALE